MSRKKDSSNNLKLAQVFLLLVFGLITLSLLVKVVLVFKNSQFDGSHQIVLAIAGSKETEVISFSPQNKTINVLLIVGSLKTTNLTKLLKIPIDSQANLSSEAEIKQSITSNLIDNVFNFDQNSQLTAVDIFRLILFTRTVPESGITKNIINVDASDKVLGEKASSMFRDQGIVSENITIEIINAANEFSLGSRLAEVLGNIGCNIILVKTSDVNQNKSKILYQDKNSYTLKKITNFLKFPLEKSSKKSVSDVTIIIGKDSLNKLNF